MKQKLLFTFISCIFFVQGFAQQNYLDTIWSGGILRTFRVYIPAVYDGQTPRPLVFQFHGVATTAVDFENYTSFRSVADTANFILVTPNGLVGTFLPPPYGQTWNTIDFDLVDDALFVSNLIDTLTGFFNIDTTRIYSAGFSNGGFMGYDLACRLNQRIAAVASVSGSIGVERLTTCSPGQAVSILEIHGTGDPVVAYEGGAFAGIEYLPVDTVISFWIENNQCDALPVITNLPDENTSDGSTVVKYEFPNCTGDHELILMKIIDGGHTWPGALGPNTNLDIIADQEIWQFFLKHRLPTASETVELNPSLEWTVFPNPASDLLHLSWKSNQEIQAPDEILISDLFGRVVRLKRFAKSDTNAQIAIDLNGLPSGSYFLSARREGQQTGLKRFVVLK